MEVPGPTTCMVKFKWSQHCMDVSVSQVNMYLGLCAAVRPTGWVLLTAAVHQGGGAFPVEAYSSHLLLLQCV
jgi:hypothetical protein